MTSASTVLRLDHVAFRVGGVHIVEDVSLSIETGEMVAVIGPNGAGKTSLLNLISGTTRATSGMITLLDHDVTKWKPHQRARVGLGRTFQTSYLLLGLTVLENVRLMAQAKTVGGLSLLRPAGRSDPTSGRALEALARVGLEDQAGSLAASLSHGDRRKVELAITLVADAKVILLDEPMAGVNVDDVPELVALIRQLQTETGSTVVMVEHHMDVVLGLAHRVAVMHHGALIAFDEPKRVMADATVQSAYLGEAL